MRRLQQATSVVSLVICGLATDAYLTLTVHCVWYLENVQHFACYLSNTRVKIVTWMEEMLAEFNIHRPWNSGGFGSNINLAGWLLHDKYGWYTKARARHTLQLYVKAGLQIRPIEIAIAAARHLVKHFHKSELATVALRKRQGQMQAEHHNLIQDVS